MNIIRLPDDPSDQIEYIRKPILNRDFRLFYLLTRKFQKASYVLF